MTNAARYNALRARLRFTRREVATATGYGVGYVHRWGHAGSTAVDPPAPAIARLEALLRERALRDLADSEAA